MKKGSSDRYFKVQLMKRNKLVPEGIEGRVAYKGSVADIVFRIDWRYPCRYGLYRCRRYSGFAYDKAQFVEMSGAGLIESHPSRCSNYQRGA